MRRGLRSKAAQLREVHRRRGGSFKALVNEALRRGLTVIEQPESAREPYRVTPLPLGRPRLASLDDVAEVLAVAEGEDHR